MLYGGIEMGGTKIICSIFDEFGKLLDSLQFPTGSPDDAVKIISAYYMNKEITSVGIGSFGPIDININSPNYGMILDTPKTRWQHYPFVNRISEQLKVPVVIDTDVNCACLGEMTYGAAKGVSTAVYITIGTGIGIGVGIGGETLKGMLHPEGGHILIRKNRQDAFVGVCPYHKDCFEGLASGPAIEKRFGMPAYELPREDNFWKLEADYIAQAVTNYILVYSPEKIILGGGVMKQKHLFPMIREAVQKYMNGYIRTGQMKDLEHYIVPAGLQGKQGIMGAYCLARKAAL